MTRYDVEAMGEKLLAEVEQQLVVDLGYYGVGPELAHRFDWSDSCQEGHQTGVLGGTLEEQSDVRVLGPNGALVADGWMDFIHGGESNPLFVFWLFLDLVGEDGVRQDVKTEVRIPQHVWDRLPDSTRDLCIKEEGYDRRWKNDPLVLAWRRSRSSPK